MAWHVPIWAYPPDERLTEIGAARGGHVTAADQRDRRVHVLLGFSPRGRATDDWDVFKINDERHAAIGYPQHPIFKKYCHGTRCYRTTTNRVGRRQRESQCEGKRRTGFIRHSLGLQRLALAIWLSYMQAADTEQANAKLTWSKLRAKMECQVLRRLSIPVCHVCYARCILCPLEGLVFCFVFF